MSFIPLWMPLLPGVAGNILRWLPGTPGVLLLVLAFICGRRDGSPHLKNSYKREPYLTTITHSRRADVLVKVSNLLFGNTLAAPMKPPMTLVSLDHQPAVISGRRQEHIRSISEERSGK